MIPRGRNDRSGLMPVHHSCFVLRRNGILNMLGAQPPLPHDCIVWFLQQKHEPILVKYAIPRRDRLATIAYQRWTFLVIGH